MQSVRRPFPPRGFTLIELLVVIGIIVLLAAILMPVVSRVRQQSFNTSTQAQMQRIMQACESYYHDFNAYPGPIANANLNGGSAPAPLASNSGSSISGFVTSSENLVLGLLGFMNPPTTSALGPRYNGTSTTTVLPPAHDVLSLNFLHPASYHYIDYVADELTTGITTSGFTRNLPYARGSTSAKPTDTIVPEFIDRYPAAMPILYSRANVGNPGIASADDTTQYDWQELAAYGSNLQTSSGGGMWQLFKQQNQTTMFTTFTANTTWADTTAVPFNDFVPPTSGTPSAGSNYLYSNPNIASSVRGKDGFILIDAGLDRTYGTLDDIILTP
jgi:prepilin-type N-terminal cleavage/methylation domain-containing protein